MRLKDYARSQMKRKDYVQQPDLLMEGVDVSKVRHSACMGTSAGVICRKAGFTNRCEGFNGNILEQSRLKRFLNH